MAEVDRQVEMVHHFGDIDEVFFLCEFERKDRQLIPPGQAPSTKNDTDELAVKSVSLVRIKQLLESRLD